jgi:exopolyphosphatase/guanosine-5'-triphosphate,3'-diphosphate pyrophosphatase
MSDNKPENLLLVAIDLGSNSFHMIAAYMEHGEIRPIDRIGTKVQLAGGIQDGYLTEDAMQRGLECLSRFRQVIDSLNPDLVRVVGTNALRVAKNRDDFAEQAEAILGYPIEIVPGTEEARLIYLGVAHTLSDDEQSRLVIDIGGGSTEFAIGERFEPKKLVSLNMGCVSYRERYFPNGVISKGNYQQAYKAASLEISKIRDKYRSVGWLECIGSAGTLIAIEKVLISQGWAEEGITPNTLTKLKWEILKANHTDQLPDWDLGDNRRGVFPSGVAIAHAIVDLLCISYMSTSGGALREGVIYDLVGRIKHEDVRERTVNALAQRYGVNEITASRVECRASELFEYVQKSWNLTEDDSRMLRWASRLHEIGMHIHHRRYHKHGEYLINSSDLAGFSQGDQQELALLVRGHCHRFVTPFLDVIPKKQRTRIEHLSILLRLAVLFKYVTPLEGEPDFSLKAKSHKIKLNFPIGWLDEHPLTEAELVDEKMALHLCGYALVVDEGEKKARWFSLS